MVTTDDPEIAEVSRKYGAEVPFIRPKELSDDYASSGAAVEHAQNWIEENISRPIYSCMLYATAPFIKAETLRKSFDYLVSSPGKTVCFGVTEFSYPIQRSFKIIDGKHIEMFQPEHFKSRSQDLEKAYHDAGQFSWVHTDLEDPESRYWGSTTLPYILPSYEVQDIDTIDDWIRAEAMYQALQKIEKQSQ